MKDEKKDKIENGRCEQSDSVARAYSHSPIPPQARSYSAILPPKGVPRR